tara:strand:+ start:79 stop:897 length:819 start_codon:yes stop_codon:yes gene_type:complete
MFNQICSNLKRNPKKLLELKIDTWIAHRLDEYKELPTDFEMNLMKTFLQDAAADPVSFHRLAIDETNVILERKRRVYEEEEKALNELEVEELIDRHIKLALKETDAGKAAVSEAYTAFERTFQTKFDKYRFLGKSIDEYAVGEGMYFFQPIEAERGEAWTASWGFELASHFHTNLPEVNLTDKIRNALPRVMESKYSGQLKKGGATFEAVVARIQQVRALAVVPTFGWQSDRTNRIVNNLGIRNSGSVLHAEVTLQLLKDAGADESLITLGL